MPGDRSETIVIPPRHPASETIYIKNLNAIRFIAAFSVIVVHTEQFKELFHLHNHNGGRVIPMLGRLSPMLSRLGPMLGRLGVVIFFVLSGFLISYLLFTEQRTSGTIRVTYFYMRRILRIWPLYFLTVSLAFLYPFVNATRLEGFGGDVIWHNLPYKFLLFVFFLPNLVLTLFGVIPFASHTWSIGAEEQFYLIWPFLNKTFHNKLRLVGGVISLYLLIKLGLALLPQTRYVLIVSGFWETSPIDCMAIGALFALVVHNYSQFARVRKVIFGRIFQWIILSLTVGLISSGFKPPCYQEFYALLFGILICNFAFNDQRIFSMENRVLKYLGKISYGLYMFHPVVIVLSIRALTALGWFNDYTIYPVVTMAAVGVSAFSYEVFEKPFIRKKLKYSKVVSGDNVSDRESSAAD